MTRDSEYQNNPKEEQICRTHYSRFQNLLKLIDNAAVINTLWCQHNVRHRDKLNVFESPERNHSSTVN